MEKGDRPESDQFDPIIQRVRFQKLTIYGVSESELELLERGAPDSLVLNFSIALFSAAISLTVTFATATVESDRVFQALVLLVGIGYVGGFFFLVRWLRLRKSVSETARTIRERLTDGDPL